MKRLLTLALVLFAAVACSAKSPNSGTPAEVNLLSMGDWGRGSSLQKTVSGSMSRYVTSTGKSFDALLTAGDNFYPYLESTKDPKWKTIFEEMYDARTLNFPFYITLGNHDYDNGKGELAKVSKSAIEFAYSRENPTSRWKLPANWYRLDFPSKENPVVSVLMLNSNKPRLNDAEWAEQLAFIDRELARRNGATWMLACCHHPLFSNGSHGDNGVLQVQWGPLFKKHKLDFFIAGHDHDIQHLQIPEYETAFLLVGGGGATTRPMRRDNRGPFSQAVTGFTHLRFTPTEAEITFVSGLEATPIHQFVRTPGGKFRITKHGETTPATTKPLQSIQGIDQKRKPAGD
jgi:hypothetical protein